MGKRKSEGQARLAQDPPLPMHVAPTQDAFLVANDGGVWRKFSSSEGTRTAVSGWDAITGVLREATRAVQAARRYVRPQSMYRRGRGKALEGLRSWNSLCLTNTQRQRCQRQHPAVSFHPFMHFSGRQFLDCPLMLLPLSTGGDDMPASNDCNLFS